MDHSKPRIVGYVFPHCLLILVEFIYLCKINVFLIEIECVICMKYAKEIGKGESVDLNFVAGELCVEYTAVASHDNCIPYCCDP